MEAGSAGGGHVVDRDRSSTAGEACAELIPMLTTFPIST